jgi:NADH pyrophosphatase NudC (nudix superfamily)
MKFCSNCGEKVISEIPEGDDRYRFVCPSCRVIHYQNPKMVVGCIAEFNGDILMCRRSIQPRYGKWTLPAGYLENGETLIEGAKRETFEEANATVVDLRPFALFGLSFVNQAYLMFRGHLTKPNFAPGNESLSTGLFKEKDILRMEIAFTVISETLKLYFSDRKKGKFLFHLGEILPE